MASDRRPTPICLRPRWLLEAQAMPMIIIPATPSNPSKFPTFSTSKMISYNMFINV